MSKVIIVLPTYGEPYVWKGKVYEKDVAIEEIRKVVQGWSCVGPAEHLRIHAMFKGRWALINELLSNKKHLKKMKLHMNENGLNEVCMNTACINMSEGSPYAGDLALVIPVCVFDDKISVKMFKPVKLPKHDDDERMGMFEPDDEVEMEELDEWCKEKGYDFHYSTGQVYEMRIDAPKKKHLVIVDKL